MSADAMERGVWGIGEGEQKRIRKSRKRRKKSKKAKKEKGEETREKE